MFRSELLRESLEKAAKFRKVKNPNYFFFADDVSDYLEKVSKKHKLIFKLNTDSTEDVKNFLKLLKRSLRKNKFTVIPYFVRVIELDEKNNTIREL